MVKTGVPGEKHQPIAVNWQTLSHNVVSSTPRHGEESNPQTHSYWYEFSYNNGTLYDTKIAQTNIQIAKQRSR